jgi:hypothetical protein
MNRGSIMTEEERKEILEWIYTNKDRFLTLTLKRLNCTILRNKTVENSSIMQNIVDIYDIKLPECIWKIKDRIIEKEKIKWCKQETMFQDFIAFIYQDGSIHKHKDENYSDDLIHTRFNVFLEVPKKGGQTYYSGFPIESKEGGYVLCKSGLHYHWANNIEEGKRITISFGFFIPKEKLDTMISFDGEIIWGKESY